MAKFETLEDGFAAAKLDAATRHLFLCLGPDCADLDDGQRTWDYLKRRCQQLNLPVMRTKAGCFRVCIGGPWLLIYPEGVWYGGVTPDRCERILQEHVLRNRMLEDWVIRTHPLCGGKPRQE